MMDTYRRELTIALIHWLDGICVGHLGADAERHAFIYKLMLTLDEQGLSSLRTVREDAL